MSSGAKTNVLNFPTSLDIFSTKINRGITVSGESHFVPNSPAYNYYLSYVPLQSNPTSVSIPGYTEIPSSGTVATFQYSVIYSGVNAGLISHSPYQSGLSVAVTYLSYGDSIQSEMLNSLGSALLNVESYVLSNVVSGTYFPSSGGTITGPLTISGSNIIINGGNVLTTLSGANSIGLNGTPFNNIYVDNIITNNINNTPYNNPSGNYLPLSGGRMTGPLYNNVISNAGAAYISISGSVAEGQSVAFGNFSHSQGNGSISSGNISFAAGTNALALHDYSTVISDQYGATSTSGNQMTLGFANGIVLTNGTNILNLTSGINNLGSSSSPFDIIWVNQISGATVGSDFIGGAITSDLTPTVSGTLAIGTLELPFSGIYAETGYFTNISGMSSIDVLSNLNIANGVDIIPDTSGINNLGSASLPFNDVYTKQINGSATRSVAWNELPAGVINSSNKTFTLGNAPYSSSVVQLFLSGSYLTPSGIGAPSFDYSISGLTITTVSAPSSGTVMIANYQY